MKYFKYFDEESELGGGMRYVETDDDNWALREVTINGDVCLASNVLYPKRRMFMADQPY